MAVTGNRGLTVGVPRPRCHRRAVLHPRAGPAGRQHLAWLAELTPFHWLQDPNPLANGLDVIAVLLFFVVTGGSCSAVAIWGLNRRDIAT